MTGAEPSLGSILRTAREARGIDLARAQRDTRIRLGHLLALENGDYGSLPEPVYVRGFIRLYADYLGLDSAPLIDRYGRETTTRSRRNRLRRQAARRTPPRKGMVLLTANRLGTALLVIGVVLLLGYFGYEFVTFARTPDLRLVEPATDIGAYPSLSITLTGETVPNGHVTITGLRQNPELTADAAGAFSVEVDLVPGSNLITVISHDPVTDRDSAPVTRTITVLLPAPSPSASPSAAAG